MFTRQEASAIKRQFWTRLGLYMKPIPSSWHEKVNWLNYKTGIKDIFFRLNADTKLAAIAIEFHHSDHIIRQIFFDHFVAMKAMFLRELGEGWDWVQNAHDEHGKPIALIQIQLPGVNVLNEQDWPALIAFFKSGLVALDRFWGDVKDSMEGW